MKLTRSGEWQVTDGFSDIQRDTRAGEVCF